MLPAPSPEQAGPGQLADNVLHFARVLRAAGLPVGTDRPLLALRALEITGLSSRADLYAVLRACLIDRIEHRALFDQAFRVFWRDPGLLEEVMQLLLPSVAGAHSPRGPSARLEEALSTHARLPRRAVAVREQAAADAQPSASDRERLRKIDFDAMTSAEWTAAQRLIAALEPVLARLPTRRERSSSRASRLDLRQLLRNCARRGGDIVSIPYRARSTRIEPLTVIVDISGSMSRYSRMFLHFTHALVNGSRQAALRVNAFVFGTRLTNVTRQLRARDSDEALAHVVAAVEDWSGGTRIGACLAEFNRRWARRVPLAASTVLLLSDGLEHAEPEQLSREMARLARSCRRLVWLNPLLRYAAFAPRARGIRAMLPHVDRLLPVHDLASLEELARVLAAGCRAERRGEPPRGLRCPPSELAG
ncbi:MAG TPA: VWA domain-containing protein [Steroidobacteraceae bacterium]|nr:VWA domain-containing protein [Steroidobacteraceae bacterium]